MFFLFLIFSNEIVPCEALPEVDLTAWKDIATSHNNYEEPSNAYHHIAYDLE